MTKQLAIRLPDDSVAEIDQLVANGRYENRSAAVRAALDRMLAEIREQQISAAIIEGYRRIPPTTEDDKWLDALAEESARHMVEEEPW